MKSETYPLALPKELLGEVRKTAKETGLSMADAMRQSIKLGLPTLRAQLSNNHLAPLTPEESRQAYSLPNPEFDELEHFCASLPKKHLSE
jgi:hypothetical protein